MIPTHTSIFLVVNGGPAWRCLLMWLCLISSISLPRLTDCIQVRLLLQQTAGAGWSNYPHYFGSTGGGKILTVFLILVNCSTNCPDSGQFNIAAWKFLPNRQAIKPHNKMQFPSNHIVTWIQQTHSQRWKKRRTRWTPSVLFVFSTCCSKLFAFFVQFLAYLLTFERFWAFFWSGLVWSGPYFPTQRSTFSNVLPRLIIQT